jgi:transglutaminase-like putative cysteine protease
MNIIALFSRLIYAQVILGIVGFALAEHNSAMVLATGGLALLSWFIVERPRGRPLPHWLITTGVLIATGWTIWLQVQGEPLILSLGDYILYLQLFKLYDRKLNRDHAQLMVLSLMQMVCAAIIGAEVIFALILVIYLVLAIISAMTFQLKLGFEEVVHAATANAPVGVEPIRPRPVSSDDARRSFRRVIFGSGIGIFIVSVILFITMPRGHIAQALGTWNPPQPKNATTGFNTQVQLGSGMQISASRTSVFNVRITQDGVDIGAPDRIFHLRGLALDRYNQGERRWTRGGHATTLDREYKLDDLHSASMVVPDPGKPLIRQDYTLRSGTEGVLFSLFPATSVAVPAARSVYFNGADQVLRLGQRELVGLEYTVYSAPEAAMDPQHALDSPWVNAPPPSPEERYSWATYGKRAVLNDPRVRHLTEQVMQAAGIRRDLNQASDPNDQKIAAAVETFLRTKFSYSMTLPPVEGDSDPLLAFLFDHHTGHCEYFASAMTAMLRSVGIRSRVISGFVAGEYNSVGGYYVVREMNAHAWVELWNDEQGWRSYDPSPPGAIEVLHQSSGGVLAALRDFYEVVEFHWINSVITYSDSQRREIVTSVRDTLSDAGRTFGEAVRHTGWVIRDAYNELGQWARAMVAIVIGGALTAATIMSHRWRKRRVRFKRSVADRAARRTVPVVPFYVQTLAHLERLGIRKPDWQTPAAFAAEVAQRDPRLDPVVTITQLFYEVRFGSRPLDEYRRNHAEKALKTLQERTRGPAPHAAS